MHVVSTVLFGQAPFKNVMTTGTILGEDGTKMSKSVGNIVDPNHLVDQYGADTARLFTMFAAPPDQSLEWSDAGVEGSHRFLKRLWAFVHKIHGICIDINESGADVNAASEDMAPRLKKARHGIYSILQQVNTDYERSQFNTVVSGCMKFFNIIADYEIETQADRSFLYTSLSILLRLLAPITPHICHIDAPWPKVDKLALRSEEVSLVIQVNGKLRGEILADVGVDEEVLIGMALEKVHTHIARKTVLRSVFVKHRNLINFVVRDS